MVLEGVSFVRNLVGARIGGAATATSCRFIGQTGDGLMCEGPSVVSACIAQGNGSNGIFVNEGVVERCASTGNFTGIRAGRLPDKTAVVRDSVSNRNQGEGIATAASVLVHNAIGGNDGEGVRTSSIGG